MPRDPPVTRQALPVSSAIAEPPRLRRDTTRWPADPIAGHLSRSSAARQRFVGFGRLRGRLGGGLPAFEGRLLGSLDELRELLDRLAIAFHAQVEQAQAGFDRGILCVECRLKRGLALGGPGAEQVPTELVRVIDVGARGLDRGLGGLGAVAGGLGGDAGGFR